jgi:hypothetical protein
VPTLKGADKGSLRTVVQHHSQMREVVPRLFNDWLRRELRSEHEVDQSQDMRFARVRAAIDHVQAGPELDGRRRAVWACHQEETELHGYVKTP